jgi:hypothetical protein
MAGVAEQQVSDLVSHRRPEDLRGGRGTCGGEFGGAMVVNRGNGTGTADDQRVTETIRTGLHPFCHLRVKDSELDLAFCYPFTRRVSGYFLGANRAAGPLEPDAGRFKKRGRDRLRLGHCFGRDPGVVVEEDSKRRQSGRDGGLRKRCCPDDP